MANPPFRGVQFAGVDSRRAGPAPRVVVTSSEVPHWHWRWRRFAPACFERQGWPGVRYPSFPNVETLVSGVHFELPITDENAVS
jgi:hypothetical protein